WKTLTFACSLPAAFVLLVAAVAVVAQTSAFHMLCNWLGTVVYFWASGAQQTAIQKHQWPTLVIFSVVFSLNIAVGNTSSAMVPVSFNQV
ncbi:unnamed protein product, partial [Hapterophycus canaliculatus]